MAWIKDEGNSAQTYAKEIVSDIRRIFGDIRVEFWESDDEDESEFIIQVFNHKNQLCEEFLTNYKTIKSNITGKIYERTVYNSGIFDSFKDNYAFDLVNGFKKDSIA
jgi:hypothetical protein